MLLQPHARRVQIEEDSDSEELRAAAASYLARWTIWHSGRH